MAMTTGMMWKQAVAGTWAAPGVIKGGDSGVDVANWQHHHGAGGVELLVPEDIIATPSLSVECTDATKALIALAYRASYPHGALAENLILEYFTDDFMVTIGNDVAGTGLTACCIDELKMSWAEGGSLMADFGFLGAGAVWTTTPDTLEALAGTDTVFKNGTGVATIGGANLYVVGAEWTHRNGSALRAPLVTRATNQKRVPTLMTQNIAENEMSLTCLADHDVDLDGDTLTHAIAATLVFTNGTTTLTWTVSNGGYKGTPVPLREREDGRVEYQVALDLAQGAVAFT